MTRLLDRLTVPLRGDGQNVRSWVHVDDHCRAIQIALCGGASGQLHHVGGSVELTSVELIATILGLCGAGWEAGLAATVQWYGANRRWWEPLRPHSGDPAAGGCATGGFAAGGFAAGGLAVGGAAAGGRVAQ